MPLCITVNFDDDDNEMFLGSGWLTKRPLLEILTIANLRHAACRIRTCAESEFRLSWIKCSNTAPRGATKCHWIYIKILIIAKANPTDIICALRRQKNDINTWRMVFQTFNLLLSSLTKALSPNFASNVKRNLRELINFNSPPNGFIRKP